MSIALVKRFTAGVIVAGALAINAGAWANDADDHSPGGLFEVTVTNVTRGQQFTPILVASHRAGVKLFELGKPASPELQIVAEEGNVAPLTEALQAMPGVLEVSNSGALLNPGASVKIKIRARGAFNHISVAAMLIPTNDAFFAVNAVQIPRGLDGRILTSVAYDAGSERSLPETHSTSTDWGSRSSIHLTSIDAVGPRRVQTVPRGQLRLELVAVPAWAARIRGGSPGLLQREALMRSSNSPSRLISSPYNAQLPSLCACSARW